MNGINRSRGDGPQRSGVKRTAWSYTETLAAIAQSKEVTEPGICPVCQSPSVLLALSTKTIQREIELNTLVPHLHPGNMVREARCVLCTAAANPPMRAREVVAGHIWFMIAEDDSVPQATINQEVWRTVIPHFHPHHRAQLRKRLLTLAAEQAFGQLRLVRDAITADESRFFHEKLSTALGSGAAAALGEERTNSLMAQYGIVWLLDERTPPPLWKTRVRLFPTPAGVEHYRSHYATVSLDPNASAPKTA